VSDSPDPTDVAAAPTTLREKLAAGRFFISAEVDPPHGLGTGRALQGATLLKEAGVDCINVGDNPTAKVRMSPLAMSVLLQRELGFDVIMHYTTRDRNALAVHSDMIGAHALGVRNILCLRGDPPSVGGYNDIVGVWDISAVGLMRFLKLLNEGVDWTGKPISGQADFCIGAACDPNAQPLEPQLRLMRRKAEAGAQFFMSQNVFDEKLLDGFLDKAQRYHLPIIVGILPLHNSRHAEFLHTQVPGMRLPDAVRERMRRAGDERGPKEGQAMARDFLALCRDKCAGVYIVPSFGRFDLTAELVAEIKS
jgi:homocysteine S-methyltransferase